jgi:hypothetical protein
MGRDPKVVKRPSLARLFVWGLAGILVGIIVSTRPTPIIQVDELIRGAGIGLLVGLAIAFLTSRFLRRT